MWEDFGHIAISDSLTKTNNIITIDEDRLTKQLKVEDKPFYG